MAQQTEKLLPIMTGQPVIPVVVLDDADHAVPLAKALVEGGLPAVEVTLRTDAALEGIRRISLEVPDAVVGAGTVLNRAQYVAAIEVGSKFVVSPGLTQELVEIADEATVPLLPGSVTSSEIMKALDWGYSLLKFFPAEQAGGAAYLKSLSSPFKGVKFCPTGGVSSSNAMDYLSLPNVLCVGGSWVAPKDAMVAGEWGKITDLAREAAGLKA